ncbi:MAG: hypothetical protein ACOVSW_13820 [Candidatus Kapaibacteriota bacterium]
MEYTSNYAAESAFQTQTTNRSESSWTIPQLLLALGLFYIALAAISYFFILTDSVYVRGLAEKMTAERIEEFIEMRSEYWWGTLIAPPVVMLMRVVYTALCIAVGIIILGQNLSYSRIVKIALFAESIFLLEVVVKVLCGLFILNVRVPDDYANFAPLSALQFFDVSSLKLWMKHPLRTVNLFELAYMLVLAYFLTPLLKKRTYLQTLGLVVSSYGLGLLLWVVALAFLLLQVS